LGPSKYKTTYCAAYDEALLQGGSPTIWSDPNMVWRPPRAGKRSRQQAFRNEAIQTCLTMKVLFGKPLRQRTAFVQSLLRLVGMNWTVQNFSTPCRRQRTLNVSVPYRGGKGQLNLLNPSQAFLRNT